MESVKKVLKKNQTPLQRLHQRCQALKQIDVVLHQTIPNPLSEHCHIANLRHTTLVMHVDSALWASQLRYLLPKLMEQWQNETYLPEIQKVEIKVRFDHQPTRRYTHHPSLSKKSESLLRDTAEQVTHPKLKSALLKLAQHGGQAHKN
ncbi:DciA family protein [Candidatus Albibeggiatoa sp. nov. BB20]|uniref:DUF721 domain-containing protein n=1 Tax=Candidatus Albibeggiatoa sp. nov. BB20 TaxID=3162723 RepID=UPI003365A8B0